MYDCLPTLTNVSKCTEGRIYHAYSSHSPWTVFENRTEDGGENHLQQLFSISCCYNFFFFSWCVTISIWPNNRRGDFMLFVKHKGHIHQIHQPSLLCPASVKNMPQKTRPSAVSQLWRFHHQFVVWLIPKNKTTALTLRAKCIQKHKIKLAWQWNNIYLSAE